MSAPFKVYRGFRPLPEGRFYQDDAHANHKEFFYGMTGSGKTTLALQRLRNGIKARLWDWIFIIDQDRQWSRRLGGYCVTDMRELLPALLHCGSVCFDPMPHFRADMVAAFDWISDFMWNFSGVWPGNKLLVMDDFPDWTPISNMEYRQHRLCEITGNGRRRGLDLFALCRTYTEACPMFRSAFSEYFCFRQPDPTCAAWAAKLGFDLERVKKLQDGEYLHLVTRTGEIKSGRVPLPKS